MPTDMRGQPSMGTGMAQSAAELMQMRPIWEEQYANGQTTLQFNEWLRLQQQMQQAPNAPKIMPSPSGY